MAWKKKIGIARASTASKLRTKQNLLLIGFIGLLVLY